jgi:hypothetical protein
MTGVGRRVFETMIAVSTEGRQRVGVLWLGLACISRADVQFLPYFELLSYGEPQEVAGTSGIREIFLPPFFGINGSIRVWIRSSISVWRIHNRLPQSSFFVVFEQMVSFRGLDCRSFFLRHLLRIWAHHAFSVAAYFALFPLNLVRVCIELKRMHFLGVDCRIFTFLHRLKCYVNHHSTIATALNRFSFNPVRN